MKTKTTTGLATLPPELHLEILSHLSCTPIPSVHMDTLDMRERFDSIFALSMTCSALRRVYHPLLWSSLEARGWRRLPRKRESVAQVVAEDVRLCAKVLRAPNLAELVQVFNVGLSEHSPEIVYKELAQCLQCLPNLHTLQITAFPDTSSHLTRIRDVCLGKFREAFMEMETLPQVHTLTLPAAVLFFIQIKNIFPSLRHMGIHEIGSRSSGLPLFMHCIPSDIHSLTLPEGSASLVVHDVNKLTNFFPELRVTPRLRIILPTSDGSLQEAENALKRMQNGWKRVHTLQLDEQLLVHAEVEPELSQRILAIAKEVLRRNLALDINKDVGGGRIKIWTSDYQLGQLVSVARL
ncbi:hypothetical protein CPB85DRAFT_1360975 [Mucidula mucida]|nr:hypothetical protein CPB85DRAFT_1360975 [Mucidula mucida]